MLNELKKELNAFIGSNDITWNHLGIVLEKIEESGYDVHLITNVKKGAALLKIMKGNENVVVVREECLREAVRNGVAEFVLTLHPEKHQN